VLKIESRFHGHIQLPVNFEEMRIDAIAIALEQEIDTRRAHPQLMDLNSIDIFGQGGTDDSQPAFECFGFEAENRG
jgi:hypothetical protein